MSGHVDPLLPWQPHTCECCLATTESFYRDIAAEYFWMGQKEVYRDMLLNVLNITIDTGPKDHHICEMCILNLRNASSFKRQVLESQKTLLVKSAKAEQLSIRRSTSLDIKLEDSLSCPDDSINVKAEQLSIRRTTSLDIKLEDSLSCPDDSIDVLGDLGDTFEDDDNSSTLNIGNEIVDSVNQRENSANRKRTINARQKQSSPKDGSSRSESAANTSPQGSLAKGTKTLRLTDIQEKWTRGKQLKYNTVKLMRNSNNIVPFKWHRNKYQCFCCKNTSYDFKILKEHMAEHRWMEIKKIVTRYNSILFHKVDISSLTCKICLQPQMSIKDLREHLSQNHSIQFKKERDLLIPFNLGDKFQCAICHEDFIVFHKLNIHMNLHYQNYICETCGAGFTNQSNLREHSIRHQPQPNQKVPCEECNIDFTNAYQKDQHDIAAHKKEGKRMCPYCGERFNGHYSRLQHMISVHGEKAPEYKCSICEKVFLRKYLVNTHVRKCHMKEKSHQCGLCLRKFFNKSDLTQHIVAHTGEKSFVCSFCGKSYSRKGSLSGHLKTHTASS